MRVSTASERNYSSRCSQFLNVGHGRFSVKPKRRERSFKGIFLTYRFLRMSLTFRKGL